MNREQWEKAKDIFESAISLDQTLKAPYVLEACAGDEELLIEIRSLLAEYDRASSFLESKSSDKGIGNVSPDQRPVFVADQLLAERFQIVKFIGAGGMAEVYQAFDKRLEKFVALKVVRSHLLSDSAIERLKREVCLAQQITHPNVCRVFDLEQYISEEAGSQVTFLTMEFLEGETLRATLQRQAPVKLEVAWPIIFQIAEGLAALHAQGIVHRDLKPSNVVLVSGVENGTRAVVTDLGIAQVTGNNHRIRFNISRSLTGKEQIVGTLDYMAPEQLTGDEITPATDVYAMGLMMYEMLVGKNPFAGPNPFATACKRFKGPAACPIPSGCQIGPDLASLILSCLAVAPDDRPANGRVLAELLTQRPAKASQGLKDSVSVISPRFSIAVLPFVSKDGDREDEYFSAGLTEELTLLLTKVEGLRVVAPGSVGHFQGSEFDIRRMVRGLKINALVTGTVRRSGDGLRVTAQIINAKGECLWAERYDREMKDVFSMQEEIANSIAVQLQMKLRAGQASQLVQHRTQNIEAYNLFLKGRFFANRRTPSNLQKAREHFKLSLQRDPHFAPASAALADCCVVQGVYGIHPPQEVFPLAKEMVFRALALAPQMAEAHCSAGCIQAIYDWDWASAERSFQRALQLDPNYATAHHFYALYCLIPQGRFAQARTQIELALTNDPLSMVINASVAVQSYFERRYDDAIHKCKEILEMDPNFGMAHFFLGQAYEQKGLYSEAIAALEHAVALTEHSAEAMAWLGRTRALAGEAGQAHAMLKELNHLALTQYVSPVLLAELLLGLDEAEAALDHLERACALRAADLIWIKVRPAFDLLRAESRFHDACKRIGLH